MKTPTFKLCTAHRLHINVEHRKGSSTNSCWLLTRMEIIQGEFREHELGVACLNIGDLHLLCEFNIFLIPLSLAFQKQPAQCEGHEAIPELLKRRICNRWQQTHHNGPYFVLVY